MIASEIDAKVDAVLVGGAQAGTVVDCSWEQEHMLSMEGLVASEEARRWLLFRCDGPLDLSAASRALDFLMDRHEAVRLAFPAELRPAQALLRPPGTWPLVVVRSPFPGSPDASSTTVAIVRRLCDRLDPEHGPLVAAAAVEERPDRWYFAIVMHLLVWDGFSTDVFRAEFSCAYNAIRAGEAPPLADLQQSYTALARRQRDSLHTADGRRRLDYWFTKFDRLGPAPVFRLTGEEPDAAAAQKATGRVDFEIGEEAAHRLVGRWRGRRVTPFVGVSAAVLMAVAQRKAIAGPVGAKVSETGRYTEGALQALGPFGSGLPLWVDIDERDDYDQVVQRLRTELFGMMEHALPLRPMLTEYVYARENSPGFSLDEFRRIRAEPSLRIAEVPYTATTPDLCDVTVTDVSSIVPLAYRSSPGMLINVYETERSWLIRAEFPLDSYAVPVIRDLVTDAGERLERWSRG